MTQERMVWIRNNPTQAKRRLEWATQTFVTESQVISFYCLEKALSLLRPGVGMVLDEGLPEGTLRAPPLAAMAAPRGLKFMAG